MTNKISIPSYFNELSKSMNKKKNERKSDIIFFLLTFHKNEVIGSLNVLTLKRKRKKEIS